MKNLLLPLICLVILTKNSLFIHAQEIALFDIGYIQERNTIFFSLSDIHEYDYENTSEVLPDVRSLGKENAEYIELTEKYRSNFLLKTKLREKDSVYIYEYTSNLHFSFAISELKSVAVLNNYAEKEAWPYKAVDYMFCLEIPLKEVPGINTDIPEVLVAIGKTNPFALEQLSPIIWRKKSEEDKETVSKIAIDLNFYQEYEIRPFTFGEEYVCQQGEYFYYLRNLEDKTNSLFARHLYIINVITNELVADRLFEEMEGISLVGLSLEEEQEEYQEFQFTGKLFKDKAPVVFNFTYHSFGCPTIVILDMKEDDVYIYCDNRH